MNELLFNDLVYKLIEHKIIDFCSQDFICTGLSPIEEYAKEIVLQDVPSSDITGGRDGTALKFEHEIRFELDWTMDGEPTNVLCWGPFTETTLIHPTISIWMKNNLASRWQLYYSDEPKDDGKAIPLLTFESETDKIKFIKHCIADQRLVLESRILHGWPWTILLEDY